jgi:hypothetical protein
MPSIEIYLQDPLYRWVIDEAARRNCSTSQVLQALIGQAMAPTVEPETPLAEPRDPREPEG